MNATVTVRFTRLGDPQRPDPPIPGLEPLAPLLDSLSGCDAVVLHDGHLDEATRPEVTFSEIEAEHRNPYIARWFALRDWLVDHHDVEWVFAVDGTDVEMLHEPWPHLAPGRLYVGSEPHTWSFPWFAQTNPSARSAATAHPGRQLLNPGIIGGDRRTVAAFCADVMMLTRHAATDLTDMGIANLAGYRWWKDRIVTGTPVHTVFRTEDRTNPTAWWRHK